MRDDEVYEYLDQVFEWSRGKARLNWIKHRVYFTEAATVFFDEDVIYFRDEEHSEDEERYVLIGHALRSRALFVVHVNRGERIRIISARPLSPDERKYYESQLGR